MKDGRPRGLWLSSISIAILFLVGATSLVGAQAGTLRVAKPHVSGAAQIPSAVAASAARASSTPSRIPSQSANVSGSDTGSVIEKVERAMRERTVIF